MAKTLRDFMVECNNYRYSTEYYNLIKECNELNLIERYLENQQFISEHHDMISNDIMSITEGYFAESVDDSAIDMVVDQFTERASNIGETIKNGLIKILNRFKNFLVTIVNNIKSASDVSKSIETKLSKIKLTDDDVSSLQIIMDKAISSSNNGKECAFVPRANQPYLSKIKLNYISSDTKFIKLKSDIAAALSDSEVLADVLINKNATALNEDNFGAISIDAIKSICNSVINADKTDIKSILAKLQSSWADAKRNGIKINISEKKLQKNINDLQEIIDKITEIGRADAMIAGAAGSILANGAKIIKDNKNIGIDRLKGAADKLQDAPAAAYKGITEIYASINKVIAQSMPVYVGVTVYRKTAIDGLSEWLKTKKDN